MPQRIHRGNDVVIYFNTEVAAPYKMFGTWIAEDDDSVQIKGTVGDNIGKEFFILKNQIKMIEVSRKRGEKSQAYGDWKAEDA